MSDLNTPQSHDSASDNAQHPENVGQDGTGTITPRADTKSDRCDEYSYHHTQRPKWWHRIDWSQVILDTLLLIVGIKLACIYSGQLKAMLDSNEISRESLTSVQRAFVSFQHFEYFRLQDADHPNVHNWDILADFENNGATSATNVIGILQVQELPAEPTDEQFKGPYKNFPAISIPPKATRTVRIPRPVPEPLIFGIDLGPVITAKSPAQTHFNRNLFVWSWIYYRDVFPKTKPHIAEFCNQLTGINLVTQNYNSLPGQSTAGNFNFAYAGCRNHNCDDEQCKDYEAIVELAENPR